MTCIVGIVNKGKVTIGGDSAGVAGLSIHRRKDPKVFEVGPFIMGFTSSFRMGQLLMSTFDPPKQSKNETDYHYMVTKFITSVKKCFKDGGFLQKYSDGDDRGGTFLVGYKGELYMVDNDYQVGTTHDNFMAVGCGDELAEGALFVLKGDKNTTDKDKIEKALSAAAYFSSGVEKPFNFVEMSKKDSESKSLVIKESESVDEVNEKINRKKLAI